MLDAELPAGAVPLIVPAVPTAADVPVLLVRFTPSDATLPGAAESGASGTETLAGSIKALDSVMALDFPPPPTQPDSVVSCGGLTGTCAKATTAAVSATPQSATLFMRSLLVSRLHPSGVSSQ